MSGESSKAQRQARRKRRKEPCPNPLFMQWLTEWRDAAQAKGLKSVFNYNKAMSTLIKFPLPLRSGKEAKMLDNFGDRICKMLDDRLSEHIAEFGEDWLDVQAAQVEQECRLCEEASNKPKRRKRKEPAPVPSSEVGQTSTSLDHGPPSTKTRKSSGREYVPQCRSGGWAILLTLLNEGSCTKPQLQSLAQPACDTSFSKPIPGSFYTAWSSMTTLIKKGLVVKTNNPAKYALTDTGTHLAETLSLAAEADGGSSTSFASTTPSMSTSTRTTVRPTNGGAPVASHDISDSDDSENNGDTGLLGKNSHERLPGSPEMKPKIEQLNCMVSSSSGSGGGGCTFIELGSKGVSVGTSGGSAASLGGLRYWYLDELGHRVLSKDAAAVQVGVPTPSDLGFLVLCRRQDLDSTVLPHASAEAPGDIHTSGEELVACWLRDEDTQERASPPGSLTSSQSTSAPVIPPATTRNFSGYNGAPSVAAHEGLVKTTQSTGQQPGTSDNSQRPHSARFAGCRTSNDAAQEAPHCVPSVVLQPGTFDIVLVVDIQETTGSGGSSKNSKADLVDALKKNKVRFDIRRLHVGDFTWVARPRFAAPGDQKDELVVDRVVERKRMDDLASSIVDGRFREQKHRLQRAGLRHKIYLVEDHGTSMANFCVPQATLQQAIVNTMVVDQFFVKHVKDVKESVAYLTIMTRYLQNFFMNKRLESCSKEEKPNYPDRLLTFLEFNEASVKTKVPTAYELLGKQLMKIPGISHEKVLPIIDLYGSPYLLMRAYQSCSTEDEKEKMLAKLKFGKLQRNIGPSISKSVYYMYNKMDLT